MRFFRETVTILFLFIGSFALVGCGDGETSYSLDDLQTVLDQNNTLNASDDDSEGGSLGGSSSVFKIDSNIDTSPNVFVDVTKPVISIPVKNSSSNVLIYTLSGADKDFFMIDENGSLYFKKVPYYSPAEDANGDNIYDVTVLVADGADIASVALNVSISENPEYVLPSIATSAVAYNENNTTAIKIQASSGTATPIHYYLEAAGFDENLFDIDELNGQLTFKNTPDFENPADNDANNIYKVVIRVTDETGYANSMTKEVTIEVKWLNDGVSLAAAITRVGTTNTYSFDAKNEVRLDRSSWGKKYKYDIGFSSTTELDGDTVSYSISGKDGTDGIFSLNDNVLNIDFSQPSSNKKYYFTITAIDSFGNYSSYNLVINAD